MKYSGTKEEVEDLGSVETPSFNRSTSES